MTILDVNVLLYAFNPRAPQHRASFLWLDNLFHGSDTIGLPWVTIWSVLRVSSNQSVGGDAQLAFRNVRNLLAQPNVILVQAGPRHLDLLEKMVFEGQASGPMVSDAVLAALAIENGATLASTDRDFSRFPGLKWVNPLD